MPFPEHTDALVGPTDATLNIRVHNSRPKAPFPIEAAFPHYVGRYRALEMVARGGMGIVLRAYDATLDREVALKMLSPDVEPESETGKRFAEEARVASRLQHSGIIPIYDAGQLTDGRPYFTMPFIQGQSLASALSRRQNLDDQLPRWLKIFEDVCRTMAYAHEQGVVHRDLKPSNVMLGEAGEVMVMDWGVAAVNDTKPATSNGYWVFGTPAYMSPEQAKGEFASDPRTDVFGLGAILCEILTGHPPYVGVDVANVTRLAIAGDQSDTEDRLRGSPADESVNQLARQCLAVDQKKRPANAAEVAIATRAILHRTHTQIHPKPSAERNEYLRRVHAVVMAALALTASAVIGAWTAREIHAGSPRMSTQLTSIHVPTSAHP